MQRAEILTNIHKENHSQNLAESSQNPADIRPVEELIGLDNTILVLLVCKKAQV